ncbi:hypothetical protein RLOatenuis_7180 [Rickettsiales bacterium]|nr:hypothetical protein RLOatenuis_7180 [Rickettsiales bacterium]
MDFTRETHNTFAAKAYDQGLRQYMLGVYQYMCTALGVTAIVAYFASTSQPLMHTLHATGMHIIVGLAPIFLAVGLSFKIRTMRPSTAQYLFWLFSALMGLSLSVIFLIYTGLSIARVFFIASSIFGAMAIYGHTTKKSLQGMGAFLFMGLIGLIIASVINLFLHSSALHFATSAIGVVVFAGLTAYDTQRIQSIYYQLGGNQEAAQKFAVIGALNLYMDFINLFVSLLTLFGERR